MATKYTDAYLEAAFPSLPSHQPLVHPDLFISRMERKWEEYDNVMSEPLRRVWGEICEALNSQIAQPSLPRPVIPAELGAGKSTSAKMYCALLTEVAPHPGVLVVVRTIEQAKEYARDINEWAGEETAVGWWSKCGRKLDEVYRYPVVVICHKNYELALDEKLVEEHERYEKITRFRGGVRRLTIVDEALEQVYIARLSQEAIKEIRRVCPASIVRQHPKAIKLLNSVDTALCEAPGRNSVVSASKLLAKTNLTIDAADRIISEFWSALKDKISGDSRLRVKEWLTALRRQLAAYRWTETEGSNTALVNSRLLLPPDSGQIFLDATGKLNSVYASRPDQFRTLAMPQVRSYETVQLRYALVKGTGKMAVDSETVAKTLDAVMAHYGERVKERRVLVVVPEKLKRSAERIWAYGGFKEVGVAHWNAIDGRNDWRDFDTVVTISINWGPRSLDLAHFLAIHGLELDDEGLNSPPDGVQTTREHRVAANMAQAIGRIRLRRMTKADGTCEPCDVFLRLPHKWVINRLDSKNILAGIQTTMTGIQIAEWGTLAETRSLAGPHPDATDKLSKEILAVARLMPPGARRELRREDFKASNGTFGRMLQRSQAAAHPLHTELASLGAWVDPGRRGQGSHRAALVKAPK
jgi:hypothetical protein